MEIIIQKNLCDDSGQTVWTIQREDGGLLFPDRLILGLNYATPEAASRNLPEVIREARISHEF